MREFVAFTIKEFHHILRDPRTMLILLVMPVVLVVYSVLPQKGRRWWLSPYSTSAVTRPVGR